jgi:SAM-dependent methyltransferase
MSDSVWYEAFCSAMNVRFTDEDFRAHLAVAEADLRRFAGHLKSGARLLDLGCGVGCVSVPLSTLGFPVVGVDNDPRVVSAARDNAERFGRDVQIVEGDVFRLGRLFPPDSFDACLSGGLLEHFSPDRIKTLLAQMLEVAPLAVASMPVLTTNTLRHYGLDGVDGAVFADGIHRNLWTERDWLDRVLRGYEIPSSSVLPMGDDGQGPDELLVVIRRADSAKPPSGSCVD